MSKTRESAESFWLREGDPDLGILGKLGMAPDWVQGERKQPPVRALSLLVMQESWGEAKAPQGDPPPVAGKGQPALF